MIILHMNVHKIGISRLPIILSFSVTMSTYVTQRNIDSSPELSTTETPISSVSSKERRRNYVVIDNE